MMVNKHGHKMVGIKAASGATKGLRGYYSGEYCELVYDRSNGEVWTKYQCSLGQNAWTEYHDSNVITIGHLDEPTTMQAIADMIARKLAALEGMATIA